MASASPKDPGRFLREIGWIPPEPGPTSYGAEQMKAFVAVHGWPVCYVLVVDSQYTVRPFLKPVTAEGVNVLGRLRNNRCFYLPVEKYSGSGRPAQLGEKFKLNDPKTHPPATWTNSWELTTGGRVEARGWKDVRQKGWASQPQTIYQVIEYRANGEPRYRRPLWLAFVAGQPRVIEQAPAAAPMVEPVPVVPEAAPMVEPAPAAAPTPRQAEAIYDERFSVEHAIRFGKQELGLVSGQFNSVAAEGREQVWVELVATVFWLLWAMRPVVDEQKATWPAWWRSRKLTPGAMRRLAAGLFIALGWSKPEVKPRGKSPGRTAGEKQEPRKRFKAIADVCEREGLWLHVDAAHGGAAAVVPELRHTLDGCDRADSIVVNPHKWLFVQMGLSVLFTRKPEALRRAFSLTPEYLRTSQGGEAVNFMDYGIPLGRNFRALKLWFTLRYFGVEGIAARIREHIRLARRFAEQVDAHPDFERLAPVPLSTVCFRAHPRGLDDEDALNDLNERLLQAINQTGEAFLSHTKLRGQFTIRLVISHLRTDEEQINRVWEIAHERLRALMKIVV